MTVKLISLHVAKALRLCHYLPEAYLFSYISEHLKKNQNLSWHSGLKKSEISQGQHSTLKAHFLFRNACK